MKKIIIGIFFSKNLPFSYTKLRSVSLILTLSFFTTTETLFMKLPPKTQKAENIAPARFPEMKGKNINDFHDPQLYKIICVNLRKLMKLTTNLI